MQIRASVLTMVSLYLLKSRTISHTFPSICQLVHLLHLLQCSHPQLHPPLLCSSLFVWTLLVAQHGVPIGFLMRYTLCCHGMHLCCSTSYPCYHDIHMSHSNPETLHHVIRSILIPFNIVFIKFIILVYDKSTRKKLICQLLINAIDPFKIILGNCICQKWLTVHQNHYCPNIHMVGSTPASPQTWLGSFPAQSSPRTTFRPWFCNIDIVTPLFYILN